MLNYIYILDGHYGRGFSISTLQDIRQFYLSYSHHSISHAVRGGSTGAFKAFSPNLGWIHYRALMRVHCLKARSFL